MRKTEGPFRHLGSAVGTRGKAGLEKEGCEEEEEAVAALTRRSDWAPVSFRMRFKVLVVTFIYWYYKR